PPKLVRRKGDSMQKELYPLNVGQMLQYLPIRETGTQRCCNISVFCGLQSPIDFGLLKHAVQDEFERADCLRLRFTAPDADGNVKLQVGIMKITSNIKNLRLKNDKNAEKHISKQRASSLKLSAVKPEIDLRGMMLEDALYATEKYLDEAYLGGLNTVTVIHGKGTGILRKGIHDMLKTNPCVKSFRLGVYGEGETGVTIVELKNS
ncbi:MAG: Smr/MutS family protein, partial [Clostridia bacterium]|nr:Smr/MutS family protein [Clostridia bacterium]